MEREKPNHQPPYHTEGKPTYVGPTVKGSEHIADQRPNWRRVMTAWWRRHCDNFRRPAQSRHSTGSVGGDPRDPTREGRSPHAAEEASGPRELVMAGPASSEQ